MRPAREARTRVTRITRVLLFSTVFPNAAKAATDSLKGMTMVADAVKSGLFKREYRDHRLEWMIRSGGLDVVLEGLKAGNIRFSNELR